MAADPKPPAPRSLERELVADFADTALIHGYKVSSHTVKEDHEREETRLSIVFVKSSGAEKQTVLKLKKGGGDDGEDGT